jgi:hypothetical protein
MRIVTDIGPGDTHPEDTHELEDTMSHRSGRTTVVIGASRGRRSTARMSDVADASSSREKAATLPRCTWPATRLYCLKTG